MLLLSFFVLFLTKNYHDYFVILLLRQLFMALAGTAFLSVIPLLLYWANCSGTSLVQRVYLSENRLCYTGYSGSMDQRVEFAFVLLRLEEYSVGRRSICIRGTFTRKTKDAYGAHQKNAFSKTLWIPRTFPVKQEQILLDFLRQHRTIWQEHSAKDFASYESYKRAGILYVFPPFITARMGQKIGRRPQTQLCGDALRKAAADHASFDQHVE